nr:MAG TPA: hypothetical protein [Caudoviricetes sp.]
MKLFRKHCFLPLSEGLLCCTFWVHPYNNS